MKARDIKSGDECRHDDGRLSYRVIDVERDVVPSHDKVYATIEYLDGGRDRRAWPADNDVPCMTRPSD